MIVDRNDLAYWFPRLEASGVPVPRTTILRTADYVPGGARLAGILDGEPVEGFVPLCEAIRGAADRLGYPAFLRTGQGSGKHEWRRTCCLGRREDVADHVAVLVEWSEMVDFLGLSTRTWAVREFLDLEHDFTAFEGMPVAREFRTFFRDGEHICTHPYWPPDSIRDPSRPDWRERLAELNSPKLPGRAIDAGPALGRIVARVAPHFDGAWSLDLARSRDGTWYAIDMAEMERSFHWPGCPHAPPGTAPEDGPEIDFGAMLTDAPAGGAS
jgi:hypothetical protein